MNTSQKYIFITYLFIIDPDEFANLTKLYSKRGVNHPKTKGI